MNLKAQHNVHATALRPSCYASRLNQTTDAFLLVTEQQVSHRSHGQKKDDLATVSTVCIGPTLAGIVRKQAIQKNENKNHCAT